MEVDVGTECNFLQVVGVCLDFEDGGESVCVCARVHAQNTDLLVLIIYHIIWIISM